MTRNMLLSQGLDAQPSGPLTDERVDKLCPYALSESLIELI